MVNPRQLLAVGLVSVGMLAAVAVDRSQPPRLDPVFPAGRLASPPFVPGGSDTTAWFCPGVPTSGPVNGVEALEGEVATATDEAQGGTATVANPTDAPIGGLVTVYSNVAGVAPVRQQIEVGPRNTSTIDLAGLQPGGAFVSALIEMNDGAAFVEQTAQHAGGDSVTPCSTSTSDTWYLADGFTVGSSSTQFVVTNPFPNDAVIDLSVFTKGTTVDQAGTRLQGIPIAGESVYVVDSQFLPRDEPVLAVRVTASRGQVVVGRSQRFVDERLGYSMTLASPSLSSQYYFADGEKAAGQIERYSVFNPGDSDLQLSVFFYGQDVVSADEDITVPRRSVLTFTATDQFPTLADGRYGINFSSTNVDADLQYLTFYVERATTRNDGSTISSSVVAGSPGGFASTRWSMAIGPDDGSEARLSIVNVDGTDATVSIRAIGTAGEVPIAGLESLTIPAASVIDVDLSDASIAGQPIVVVSTGRLFVERILDRGDGGSVNSSVMPG